MRSFEIRRLVPEDAEQLVTCFERCYGDTYPSNDFYDPEVLRERIAAGTLRSVVAIAQLEGEERLVGHTGLTVRPVDPGASAPRAAVAGNTVVDPGVRGQGILGKMGKALAELCQAEGFVGYVHYPTTAHTIMQERSVRQNGVETGIQLAYVPAETDYREIDRSGVGRLAATVVYQPLSEAPRREVYLPRRYRERLSELYRLTGLQRTVLSEEASRAAETPLCRALCQEFDSRMGVLRLEIREGDIPNIGANLGRRIDAAIRDHRLPVVHADLYLDDPCVDQAVETLRSRGFLYCSLLPELAHTDLLRLQLVTDVDGDPFEANLANPGARGLLDLMVKESKETRIR